jgi:predicted RNA binding protein YcfA (HicA-like mRNA interferase family)
VLKLKKISGKDCVKILCNKFDFNIIRQKGSHIILKKEMSKEKIGTVIPNHPELKIPTLKNALKLAKVEIDEFAKHQ